LQGREIYRPNNSSFAVNSVGAKIASSHYMMLFAELVALPYRRRDGFNERSR
jgi:hypothetical protein